MCARCTSLGFESSPVACTCACSQLIDPTSDRVLRAGKAMCRVCVHFVPVARVLKAVPSPAPAARPSPRVPEPTPRSLALDLSMGKATDVLARHFRGELDRDIAPALGLTQATVAAAIARAYRLLECDRPGTGCSTRAKGRWDSQTLAIHAEFARAIPTAAWRETAIPWLLPQVPS